MRIRGEVRNELYTNTGNEKRGIQMFYPSIAENILMHSQGEKSLPKISPALKKAKWDSN